MPVLNVKIGDKFYPVGGISSSQKKELIDEANKYAEGLKKEMAAEIADLTKAIGETSEYLDGAFLDGIISELEAKTIATHLVNMANKKAEMDREYLDIFGNVYIDDDSKAALTSAKMHFDDANTTVINEINTAISDALGTKEELALIEEAFTNYRLALSLLISALNHAIDQIGSEKDLESYDNMADMVVGTITPINTKILSMESEISQTAQEILLKVTKSELVTAMGNVKQEALDEANAYANDIKAASEAVTKALSERLASTEEYVDGAFLDGIITSLEASGIATYINDLNTSKATFDITYTDLYSNPYLLGTYKSNLLSAKTNLNSSHNALIKAIEDAIQDSIATPAESGEVDNRFQTYADSVAVYSLRVSQGTDSIAKEKSAEAQANAEDYTDGVLVPIKATLVTHESTISQLADSINLTVTREEFDAGLVQANTYSDNLKKGIETSIEEIEKSVTDTNDYINEAFRDGIIYEAEFKKIQAMLLSLSESKLTMDSRYNSIYTNASLTGTPKSTLATAKDVYDTRYTALVKIINDAIADSLADATESEAVNTAFINYNNSISLLASSLESAVDAITKAKSDKALADAKTYTNGIKTTLEGVVSSLDSDIKATDSYIENAFKDGIITAEEAKRITGYLKIVDESKGNYDQKYTEVYANPDLGSSYKTQLKGTKDAYDTVYASLILTINNAIADGKSTIPEANAVDAEFKKYNLASRDLTSRLEKSIDNISRNLADKALADAEEIIKPIDARLKTAESDILVMDEAIRLKVSQEIFEGVEGRVDKSESEILLLAESISSKVTSEYVRGEINKIEVGSTNLLTESEAEWSTTTMSSNSAYGVYRTGLSYIYKDFVGKDLTIGFDIKADITGEVPKEVRVYGSNVSPRYQPASKTVTGVTGEWQRKSVVTTITEIVANAGEGRLEFFGVTADVTKIYVKNVKIEAGNKATAWSPAPQDVTKAINGLSRDLGTLTDSLVDLDEEINTTFKDGVITQAEALSIGKYTNLLNSEKANIDNRYNTIYADTSLSGTPKTDLNAAKVAYNTAHTNLLTAISSAISDGATTATESANVTSKFTAYNTALSTLSRTFETAISNIAQTKANTALFDAKAYTTTEVGKVNTAIEGVTKSVTDLNTSITTTFKDGIIEQSEANSISTYINALATEKINLDNRYTTVYADSNLSGYPKSDLLSKKTAYDTAHGDLINAINVAISDGKTTTAESATVDSKFALYSTAVGNLSTSFENAITNIASSLAGTALFDAKQYTTTEVGKVNTAIANVSKSVTDLNTTITTTFKDGIIEESEAKAIKTYINALTTEKSGIDNRYTTVYNDSSLVGAPKTALLSKKTAYDTAHTALIKSINDAIADSKTTTAESTNVNSKFALYSTALGALSTAFEDAITAISQKKADSVLFDARSYTTEEVAKANTAIAGVSKSITDLNTTITTTFKDGIIEESEAKAIKTYINALVTEKANLDNRYATTYYDGSLIGAPKTDLLAKKTAYDTAHGNLITAINSAIADNKTTATESSNVNSKFTLYTTAVGALAKSFETAISAIAQKKADTALFDANAYTADEMGKVTTTINGVSKSVSDLNVNINTTFKDGIIEESEAAAIGTYINALTTEKANLDNRYNTLYADVGLTGTPKTDLLAKKTSYDTSHTNLISAINTAIADGKTTTAESTNVDSKFTLYTTALGALSKSFETGVTSIAQSKANTALFDAKAFTTDEVAKTATAISNVTKSVTDLNTTITTTFKDGVIEESEAKSIAKYINALTTEKTDLDNRFTTVYADVSLSGTPKTDLNSKKTLYNTAHTNLLSSINTAISDGKTTTAESTDVNAKFALYATALGALSKSFETAVSAIAQKKSDVALSDANSYTTGEVTKINTAISNVTKSVTDLNTTITTTFKDGVIEESEAKSITKYINALNTEKASLDIRFTTVYADTSLSGAPKTDLNSKKTAYNTAHTNLLSSINTAISDKKTTATEAADVDAKFALYSTALSNLSKSFETAISAIAQKKADDALFDAKAYTTTEVGKINTAISNVTKSVTDLNTSITTTFKDGIIEESEAKSIAKYINALSTEKTDLDNRYTTIYADASLSGTPKTDLNSKKTAYNTAHSALILSINNAIADGKTTTAESTDVNSKFTAYSTALGSLSVSFETAISSIAQVKATKALTDANGYTNGKIADVNKAISDVSLALTTYKVEIDTTFKDGVITEAEAISIGKYANTLNSEKSDIDSRFSTIYGDPSLSGSPKTDLNSKKTAYNAAHTNLINSINSAIADKKTTATETADVNAKFTAYSTALANLSKSFESAITSIAQKKVDDLKTSYVDPLISWKSTAEQLITADAITSTVKNSAVWADQSKAIGTAQSTADTVGGKLDNLKIGGRNYLSNTKAEKSFSGFATYYNLDSNKTELSGEIVTVSFEAKHGGTSVEVSPHVYYRTSAGANIGMAFGDRKKTTTEYQRFEITMESSIIPPDLSTYATLAIRKDDSTNTLFVRNVKLEKGNRATDWTPSTEEIDSLISTAQSSANSANASLTDIMSDLKITSVEKSTLKTTWDRIQAEYTQLLSMATSVSVPSTTFTSAYTALNSTAPRIQTDILANMTATYTLTTTTRDNFKAQFNTYFVEAEKISKAISDKINNTASTANSTANNLKDVVLPALTSRVQSAEQKITAEAITSTVTSSSTWANQSKAIGTAQSTADTVGGKLDNLKIGGTNLALDTNSTNWELWGATSVSSSNGTKTRAIKATRTGTSAMGIQQASKNRKMKLENGEDYIISFKIRGTVGLRMNYVFIMNINGTSGNQNVSTSEAILSTTSYQTISMKFKKNSVSDFSYIMISTTDGEIGTWFEVEEIKVEKGNLQATDWTPAPEDVDALISTAQSSADSANSSLTDIMSDLKITPVEKSTLRVTWDKIKAEYTQLLSMASSVAVPTSVFTTAYNALNTTAPRIQTDILANMTTTYTLTSATVRDNFKNQLNTYFVEAEKLSKAVSDKINGVANTANNTANTLKDVTVPALLSRVSTAEQKITADAIVGTVKSSSTWTTQALAVTNAQATADTATTKIDTLQIGGQNLLANSTFNYGNTYWGFSSSHGAIEEPHSDKPKSKVYGFNHTATSTVASPIYNTNRVYLNPKIGDTITFSADIYCDDYPLYEPSGAVMTFRRFTAATGGSVASTVISPTLSNLGVEKINGQWSRGAYTYTFTSGTAVAGWYAIGMYLSLTTTTGVSSTVRFKIREMKVEKGSRDTTWSPSIEDVGTSIEDSMAEAKRATDAIADMSSDGKITPVEKVQLKKEWATIMAEKVQLDTMADTFGFTAEKATLKIAYDTLNGALATIFSNMKTTSVVVATTFRGQFDDYYDKKAVLQRKASETARGLANGAQTDANTANKAITDMSSDGIITPVEKVQLQKEWAVIKAEKVQLDATADAFGITAEKATLKTAYDTLSGVLTTIFSNMKANSSVTAGTFRGQFDDFYDKKAILQRKVSETARTIGLGAQTSADTVAGKLDNLQLGGRNILKGSNTIRITNSDQSANMTATFSEGISKTVIKVASAAWNLYQWAHASISDEDYFKAISEGKEYTFSADVRFTSANPSSEISMRFDTRNPGSSVASEYVNTGDTGGKWVRLYSTMKAQPRAIQTGSLLHFSAKTPSAVRIGDTLEIRNLKIEKGNRGSDWTPAPEDVDALIKTAQDEAEKATKAISDMSSDGIITPVEKVQLQKEWATIKADKAQLDIMANTFNLTAEKASLKTAYDTLNSVLATIFSNMKVNSTVTATTFRAQFDDFYDKKAILQRRASETARAIGTGAQESIDGLQIGGRNLFANSGNFLSTTGWSGVALVQKDGFSVLQGTSALTNSVDIPLESDTEYVVTVEIMTSANTPATSTIPNHLYVRYAGESTSSALEVYYVLIGGNRTLLANTWNRVSIKFKTKAGTKVPLLKFHGYNGASDTKWIKNVKLEKGNKATDWTPAPEDVDALIANAQAEADKSTKAINDMSTDGIITPVEKVQLQKEWATIKADKVQLDLMADTFSMTTEKASLKSAYDTLNSVLATIFSNMKANSTVTAGTFRAQFDDFYDKKAVLQRRASELARGLANAAQIDANDANSKLGDIMSDLKITAVEKSTLKLTWDEIQAKHTNLYSLATSLGVPTSTYLPTYTALNTTSPRIQTDILANMTTTYSLTTATRDSFKAQMNAFFVQYEALNKAVSAKVNDNAGTAQSGVNDLVSDLKITPLEKSELSRTWEIIKAQYGQLNAQALALGVSSTLRSEYTSAYNVLNSTTPRIQTDILASMTSTYTLTTATRDSFKAQITTYQTKAQEISKAITDKLDINTKTVQSNVEAVIDSTGNLLTNPSVTGDTSKWSNGNLSTQTFQGVATKVIESISTSNTTIQHSYFEVDPSKAYEVSMWIKKSQPTPSASNTYIGTYQQTDTGAGTSVTPISISSGTAGTDTTNFYFFSKGGTSNFSDWEKVTGYILPSGFTPANAKGISSTASNSAMMKPNTKKMTIRVLNWSNTSTTPGTMWIAHPKVVEVPTDVIERVTVSESKITQLADEITSKVSKTDYNGNTVTSMINQTATTIKLKAGNIELLGITTVAETLFIGGSWEDANYKSLQFRGDSGKAYIASAHTDDIDMFGMANATVLGLSSTLLGANYFDTASGPELESARITEVHGRTRLSLFGGDYGKQDEFRMTGNKNITFNEEVIAIGSSRVLWTGSIFLQASQIITPSRTLSECPNGWILVWSRYVNSAPANSDWNLTYIPKEYPSQAGASGMWAPLVAANVSADTPPMAFKYVYPNNTRVMGHDRNRSGNESGQVLRAILAY